MTSDINLQTFSLPDDLSIAVKATLDDWQAAGRVRKLWARDPSVWTNSGEDKWLGWLDIVAEQLRNVRRFTNFAAEVNDAKFSHVLLMGMGGSSPESADANTERPFRRGFRESSRHAECNVCRRAYGRATGTMRGVF